MTTASKTHSMSASSKSHRSRIAATATCNLPDGRASPRSTTSNAVQGSASRNVPDRVLGFRASSQRRGEPRNGQRVTVHSVILRNQIRLTSPLGKVTSHGYASLDPYQAIPANGSSRDGGRVASARRTTTETRLLRSQWSKQPLLRVAIVGPG